MTTSTPFLRAKAEVADKVRKLLTQAEDPAATAEEAQSFTLKAQQLMTKYSIDVAMIGDAGRVDTVVDRGWTIVNPYASHKVSLVNAVARANDCRAIYADLDGGRKRIDVIGYGADVEWVEILYHSLEVQLMAALAGAVRRKPANVHGRTFSAGFAQGFAMEIAIRLQRARKQAVDAADAARAAERTEAYRLALAAGLEPETRVPSSVELVLVAKAETVDREFTVRHPSTRTVHRQTRLRSWSGYAPGRDAGSKASLARGAFDGRRGLSA
ncbi:MAG: hypothetical protein NVSMB4_08380 [Acidimicrobiales bacterium]